MTSNKWEEFKRANASNLKIDNPSAFQESDGLTLASDWVREANMGHVTINNVPLKNIAQEYDDFATDADVEKFFRERILINFTGDKDSAIAYLKQTFHQRGLMYPVSTGLQKEFDTHEGRLGSLNGNYLKKSVNIETTDKGFKVQESAEATSILAAGSMLETYALKNEYGVAVLSSDNGQSYIIQAQGIIDIDFSSDAILRAVTI